MKGILRSIASLASWCVGLALIAACLRNVFGNSLDVEQKAFSAACGGRPGCEAQLTRIMRTPIEHSYVFVARGQQVEVECRREFILIGDYTCNQSAERPLHMSYTSAPVVKGRAQR